jgi:hypothetical protein
MKHILRAIALSGFLVLLTFSSALGQSDRQNFIHIPFDFTVGEKSFSAGKYAIERNRKDSDAVWVIRDKENGGSVVLMTQPTRSIDTQEDTKLVFHRYDDVYFLSEIWTPGSNTGRKLQISDREKALDKVLAVRRQDHVLTGRGR